MFTGIIESIGKVKKIMPNGQNKVFVIASDLSPHLVLGQSIAHDGICLTVEDMSPTDYQVTAVAETLKKTNLDTYVVDQVINLERSIQPQGRMDGHWVQGHVDTTAKVVACKTKEGSHLFVFELKQTKETCPIIDQGSVCVNGVSLTCVDVQDRFFSVNIVPYTYKHTNFSQLSPNEMVNIEFDIMGKYIYQYLTNNPMLKVPPVH